MSTTDRYQHGIIYKLVSNYTDKIYIGSTCMQLSKRKSQHETDYNRWKGGKFHFITSFDLYNLGDVDIVLIEQYPCNSKMELHARERYYIEQMDCINKCIPGRTNKEWYEDNKDKVKQYYEEYRKANIDKIKQTDKEYYQANKDKRKQYYQDNKDKVKQYYQANKDKMNIKVNCECGSRYIKRNMTMHVKSKKHQKYVNHKVYN